MKNFLRQIPGIVAIIRLIRRLSGLSPQKLSQIQYKREQVSRINGYIQEHKLRKLQIGAQSNSISGWLNVDIEPKENHVVYLDATTSFPIPDNSFDYVFTEHMIEHIAYEDADFMISECSRILKPGGKIRIATPDIMTLVKILQEHDSEDHSAYVEHYFSRFFGEDIPKDPIHVVNKLFYGFHHRFIHGESTLRYLLEKNSFDQVHRFEVGKSDDPELTRVEQHWREMGEIPNKVETIVIQAVKNG